MVHASSFSKRPCWLLSSLSSLCTEGWFIESQLFCLPEFHPLVIRNESHLRSISSQPVSKQKNQPTDQLLISVMWAVLPPQWMWATAYGVCTARHWLGGYSWALGLHSNRDARAAQYQEVGSHKLTRANTAPAEKSLSFPCCLSLLVKWPHYSPYLQKHGFESKFLTHAVLAPLRSCCSFHCIHLYIRYALTPFLKGIWVIDW